MTMAAARGRFHSDLSPFLTLFLLSSLLAVYPPGQPFGLQLGILQQSGEKSGDRLEPDKPVKRTLVGSQPHLYRVWLNPGQFLKVVVEQDGVDVEVQVSGPDGKQILGFDSESRSPGQKTVSLVAATAGDHLLAVRPRPQASVAGGYEIRIEELRVATENDRALYDARQMYEKHLSLRRANEYDEAISLMERVLEIRERILGPEHSEIAAALNNLALLYRTRGDYGNAERLYERSLTMLEKMRGPEHMGVASTLSSLAAIYRYRGEYAKSERFYRRVLTIRRKLLAPEHPDIARALNNLASAYRYQGQYAKAAPLFQQSRAILEKSLGPEHEDVAYPLNNLAELYWDIGEYAKAEPLFRRVLTIFEKALGPEHSDVAYALKNLANLYRGRGEYARAEPIYQRALGIWEKTRGPEHPQVAEFLNNLAALYAAKGDVARAIEFQKRANAVSEYNLAINLVTGSERQKLAYLATISGETDQTLSLHLRSAPDDEEARGLAATIILQRKGRALDATAENLNALRRRFEPKDQALLDQLTSARSQIARLVLDGPQRMTAEQYRDRIKKLEDQAEKDESDISRRSSEFRAQFLPVTLAAVQSAIPADAALIEFATYRPFYLKGAKSGGVYGQPRYAVYVLRHQGEIGWMELGEMRGIDRAITELRRALRSPKRTDVDKLASIVDRKIFRPLRPLLGDATRLLISPEGELNLIPFAALVDEKGRYLAEHYSITYLASGRDLLRLQVARESKSGPLVVADPDFGGSSPAEPTRRLVQKTQGGRLEKQATVKSADAAFGPFYFPALPYTAEEGEALQSMLAGTTLLTRRQANKTALMQVRSPALLHIATHGFFLEDLNLDVTGVRGNPAFSDDPARMLQQLERRGIRIENSLLRSGLALAGANERKKDDNGILTALELTGMNLWGTKMVVLSACDTGVGEVRNGDGVHGLRRALVLAGSETQVMSLWPVSDRGTRELMVAYYGELERGLGRGEALRQVQLKMIKDVKRRHPYYWASFIQSGEWANLEGRR